MIVNGREYRWYSLDDVISGFRLDCSDEDIIAGNAEPVVQVPCTETQAMIDAHVERTCQLLFAPTTEPVEVSANYPFRPDDYRVEQC